MHMISSKVLIVCTGNIFRSLLLTRFLRKHWADRNDIAVESAGTNPSTVGKMHRSVRDALAERGIDISDHMPRRLQAQMVEEADVVVAMSTDHFDAICAMAQAHGLSEDKIQLFNNVREVGHLPLFDVHEGPNEGVLLSYEQQGEYVHAIAAQIESAIPVVARNIDRAIMLQRAC
jgi:protein-tyrosine phosphatase